jgi:hypothetical protein
VTSSFNLHSLLRNYLKLFREDSVSKWNNVTYLHILILRGRKLPPLLYMQRADPWFCVRGTKVGEGSRDRLRSPAGPGLWQIDNFKWHLPLIYTHCLETIWNFFEKIHAFQYTSSHSQNASKLLTEKLPIITPQPWCHKSFELNRPVCCLLCRSYVNTTHCDLPCDQTSLILN